MIRLWLACSFFIVAAAAQNRRPEFPPDIFDTRPMALDPAHFHLIFENDRVQVIRVHLGPHEKSTVMEIPAHVLACVTDRHVRVHFAHTKTAERSDKAGFAAWMEREEYGLENLEDKPAEWILVVPNGTEKSG